MKRLAARLLQYANETFRYGRDAADVRSFVDVMRVRLSQSRVGRFVCPSPIVVDVNLRSLGRRVRLRSHTTDISVLGELIVGHGYDSLIGVVEEPVETIVDLGANTGLAARWLSNRWPHASTVCVEPESGNLAVLRCNAGRMPVPADVVSACVGAVERRVRLSTAGGEFAFSMSELDHGETSGDGDVEVMTLTAVLDHANLAGRPIDVLKCDIEGAEAELFASCAPWIKQVRTAIVECHDGYHLADLLADLRVNGAEFEVKQHIENPEFSCEVVALHQRG